MSTEFIGKCSWYFSHPTTRIEYNSRSSGCQMLQPVLFYKPPNDVAPGAGRRTHRVVWRPHSHAFALTNNSVTVHVSSQSRKSAKRSHMSSRKGKAAEAQPEAQIECVEIHVPADEMIEILPGSLRFSCIDLSVVYV